MIVRGDRQSDIAAYFGVNGGRIAEINTDKYGAMYALHRWTSCCLPGPISRRVGIRFAQGKHLSLCAI
jgi:hypothetical protein